MKSTENKAENEESKIKRLRTRGLDLMAKLNDPYRTVESLLAAFDNPQVLKLNSGELAGEVIEPVEKIISSFGKGARAFIWFDWDRNKSGKWEYFSYMMEEYTTKIKNGKKILDNRGDVSGVMKR